MTLAELLKDARPGFRFHQQKSTRILAVGEGLMIVVDDWHEDAAALFSDELAADDWEAALPEKKR